MFFSYYKVGDESNSDSEKEDSDSDIEGLGIDKKNESKSKKSVTFASDVEEESDDDDLGTSNKNPLITDLVGDNKGDRKERKAENWFSKVRYPSNIHLIKA